MAASKGFAAYLQGNEPLEKRLCTGERAFLAPLSIPPPQKEDIVVLWLSHILTTDKALSLSSTELEAAWCTLKRILSSRRLQALCRNHWLCPITSSLTETVVSTLCDDTSTDGVRHNIVGVCDAILNNSSLAPLILHHSQLCYKLLNGLLYWILAGNKCDTTVSITLLLARDVASHIRSQGSRKDACQIVLKWIFVPTARIMQELQDDERSNVKSLITQLNKITTGTMFERELLEMYKQSLLILLAQDNKAILKGAGEEFFTVLGSALAEEILEVNEFLINNFLKNFMIKYKSDTSLLYQMVVVLVHMLGITWKCEKGPCIEANSLAGQKLVSTELHDEARLQLLLTVLKVLESVSIDLSHEVSELSLADWLQNLSMHLLQERQPSPNVYRCLQTIMAIYPTLLTNKVEIVFANVICCEKKTYCDYSECDPDKLVESLNDAYDNLMCAILDTFIKLRSVPKMYSKLLNGIKEKRSFLANKSNILPLTPMEFEKGLLLPPKFMSLLNDAISHLSFRHVMDLWTTALHFLKNECCPLLCAAEKAPGDLEYANLVLWLLSYIVGCSPVLSAVAVPGMAPKVAALMTKMANDGITPLSSVVAEQLVNNNNKCLGPFLSFCYAWGEAHLLLCTTEEGYTEFSELPKIIKITEGTPLADFSYLFPFVTSIAWDKYNNTVCNNGDQQAKLAWVQLGIQKLSHIISLGMSNGITISLRNNFMTSLLENLSTSDIHVGEYISFHLTYILPYVIEDDMPMIARHLLTGFREEKKMWVKYVQSDQFKEAGLLHSYLLSNICTAISTVTNSRKRHISGSSESEECAGVPKNYGSKLLKKISKNASMFINLELTKDNKDGNNALFEFFTECGGILSKAINSGVTGTGLGGNSQELLKLVELLSYLPLPHMDKEMQTALLLVLFPVLIYEGSNGREELVSLVVKCINEALCAPCPLRLLNIMAPNDILQWLISEIVTQSTKNVPIINQFFDSEKLLLPYDINSQDSCINTVGLQHMLKTMLQQMVTSVRNAGHVTTLAEFITTSAEKRAPEKRDEYLQVAVIFATVCFKFLGGSRGGCNEMSVACNWAVYHLSMWALRLLKQLDLLSAAPNTAANLLSIHMLLIQLKCKKSADAPAELDYSIDARDSKDKKEGNTTAELDESIDMRDTNDKKEGKAPKWQKIIRKSVQLSELCLKSGNDDLERCALDFLSTVATHAVILGPMLPQGLLSTAWSALKQDETDKHNIKMPDKLSNKGKSGANPITVTVSLAPLFTVADAQEYEELLLDLLKKTQDCIVISKASSESVNNKWEGVSHTLGLWQIVVNSRVEGQHGALKRQALDHLTAILVGIVSSIEVHDSADIEGLVIPVLQTMVLVLGSGVSLAPQRRAQNFVLCTTIPLHNLDYQLFLKVFPCLCEVLNLLVTRHDTIVSERTPSLMAAITHLSTGLVAQANQEKHFDNGIIKELEVCSNNLERVIRELSQYSAEVNKIVHFTVANIVEALQQTTVYPAIKNILESIVYRLLDLCDAYCLKHLMVALPPATTTLLKHLHTNYTTYRRFRE